MLPQRKGVGAKRSARAEKSPRVIAERQHRLRLILRRHDGAHVTLLVERRVLERVQQSDIRLLVVGLLLQQARLEVARLLACNRGTTVTATGARESCQQCTSAMREWAGE